MRGDDWKGQERYLILRVQAEPTLEQAGQVAGAVSSAGWVASGASVGQGHVCLLALG